MNKYLFKKIEQANGAYFENLVFIANEVCRPQQSEVFQEFCELKPDEIAKVLGWNNRESTYKMIEESIKDKEFASTLLEYDLSGFLAECRVPQCSDFRFDKDLEKPRSWSVQNGICTIIWIYAESIGELAEKLAEKAEDLFLRSVKASKLSDPTQNQQ